MTRPSLDLYFMRLAALVATRSTCLRRAVGCVLVDARGHVLSTGYNGVAAGQPHCNERAPLARAPDGGPPRTTPSGWGSAAVRHDARGYYGHPHACAGAELPSGEGLDLCEAIHAEQNALLQCGDVGSIATCYCTTFPCLTCVKLLLNTSCARLVYAEPYPAQQERAETLWRGRAIVRLDPREAG